MRESKAELTDRLRREGRWDAFKKRREALKSGGVPAPEAWTSAAAEFPPPTAPPSASTAPTVDLRPLRGKPIVSIVQAATWAFEHLDDDWTQPADAPSAGAWGMREWARSSMSARSEFYRTFIAKIVLPPQEAAREAEETRAAHMRDLRRRMGFDPEPILVPEPEEDAAFTEQLMVRLKSGG